MKKRTIKRILACALSLIMAFGMVETVSAAKITDQLTTNTSSSNGKLRITMSGESGDYSVVITSKNLKNGKTSKVRSYSTVVDLGLAKNTWYKTTIKGYDSYGDYNGNKHTYYLAKSPKVKISYASGCKMKVKWNKVSGTSYYKVYMKKGSGSWKCVKTTKKTSYKTGKLKKYKNYYFYVRAVKKSGGKKYYSATPNYRPSAYIYTTYK